jgi:hypothetical protein
MLGRFPIKTRRGAGRDWQKQAFHHGLRRGKVDPEQTFKVGLSSCGKRQETELEGGGRIRGLEPHSKAVELAPPAKKPPAR